MATDKKLNNTPQPRVVCYSTSELIVPASGYVLASDGNLPPESNVPLFLPIALIDQFKAEEKARSYAAKPPLVPLQGIYAHRSSVPLEVLGSQDISTFATRLKRLQKTDKSDGHRLQLIDKQLKALGPLRHRMVPLCQENPELFDSLLVRFPHFAEVIRIYKTSSKAGAARNQPMSPPPILMVGVPGLGKTHFAQALAECMGLPLAKLSFDSGVTNSLLVGSDKHWGNSHHGELFERLCMQQVANPVFFLDEIDKAAQASKSSGQSSLDALHTCLESTSARSVKDISLDITMDTSSVVWLAATNRAETIPSSIRSRFTEVEIRPPIDPEEMYQLNWHLCQAVVEPLGMQLPDSTIRTSLAVLSPREQRKHLQAACESAAASSRNYLQNSDFPVGIIEPPPVRRKKSSDVLVREMNYSSDSLH